MDQLLIDQSFPPIDEEFPDLTRAKIKAYKDANRLINGGVTKPVKKSRSRNGCLSCKKLKIKCNEGQPICEYCIHRGRECIYPEKKPKAPRKRKPRNTKKSSNQSPSMSTSTELITIPRSYSDSSNSSPASDYEFPSIQSKSLQKLNSMSVQLDVSTFELRLLKFYMDFGATFFTFNIDPEAHHFWGVEVPKLWCTSDLVKSSIYAISSVRLLANYKLDSIRDIYIEDERLSTIGEPSRINLLQESEKYLTETSMLLHECSGLITSSLDTSSELKGQLAIAKVIVMAIKCVLPKKFEPSTDTINMRDCGVLDLINFNKKYFNMVSIDGLVTTRFKPIFATHERKITKVASEYFFISYLKGYVTTKLDTSDFLQIAFLYVISSIELGAHRSLVYRYPIPFFRSIIIASIDCDFIDALKALNHTAMKITYYYSCICSVLDFKLFRESGIWDEFVEIYRVHSFNLFNGDFEDEVDKNMYECVLARREQLIPWNLEILRDIGKPVDYFTSGKIQLVAGDRHGIDF